MMYQGTTGGGGPGNEIVRAGYLTKSPPEDAPSISQWRRRWFVLRDSLRSYPLAERYVRLEYYQNEGEARKLADPKGIINLTECYRVSGCAPVKGHKFVFDVCTKERKYHLAAETPSEKHEWIEILNEVLFATSVALPQVKTQDLEDAEFQIQRRKSQTRTALKQTSFESITIEQPRPQSFYEAPLESRKKRPLPPTPESLQQSLGSPPVLPVRNLGSPLPSRTSPVPPIPKPRNNKPLEVQKSLPIGVYKSNGSMAENCEDTTAAGSPSLSRGHPYPHPSYNTSIQPSDYEVPVQAMSGTKQSPFTHGRNSVSAPSLQHDYDEVPPLPPPRRKGNNVPDTDYDVVTLPEGEQDDEEEEAYGHLIRIQTSQPHARHSDPAVIPLQNPGTGSPCIEGKRYYENTGYIPIKEETYTKLSHYH